MRKPAIVALGAVMTLVLAVGAAVAAPPGSEVWETEQVQANFAGDGNGHHYHLELLAERRTNGSYSEMWLEATVAVFGAENELIDECGDAGFVDPSMMETFEDDLSHVFVFGEAGAIGSGCFWESIFIDLHWDATGPMLNGNAHDRQPGWLCSSQNERRTATVGNNIGLGNGPEGPTGPYENQVFDDAGVGEIFHDVTACHATGSRGPAR